MKTKVTSLLVAIAFTSITCTAQQTITVEATNNDISNNLDLQAVASAFGESSNLQDFERRLNDYDSQISNLDLNNDGEVDYLRVIEDMENNVHVVVIQAVLDKDVYQDVATIVVEKRENRRTMVQVIGDPYLYGDNYVIEPVYMYTPPIFSAFWGYNYQPWYSPYSYGYYPRYFRYHRPYEINIYLSNIDKHINHDFRYYYGSNRRNEYAERLQHSIGRNDYGDRHPDYNFSRRNDNVNNKREIENNRGNNSIQYRNERINDQNRSNENNNSSRMEIYGSGTRSAQPNRTQDDIYQRRSVPNNNAPRANDSRMNNENRSERNVNTQTYPQQPSTRQTEINRDIPTNVYQQRPNVNVEIRQQQPAVTRGSDNSRPAPVVNQPQPSRQIETKAVERRPVESKPTREADKKTENRSSNNNAGRR
jgi:hypothetical protein